MTTTPELRVRLLLREALERIDDARCTATDAWTATRLQVIERELEDTLTLLAPKQIALHAGCQPPTQLGRGR
jgi:hypothetical protein